MCWLMHRSDDHMPKGCASSNSSSNRIKRCGHAFSYSGAVSHSSYCGVRIIWSAVAAAAAAAAAAADAVVVC